MTNGNNAVQPHPKLTSESFTLTQERAREIIEKHSYPRQRPLREWHLKRMIQALKTGNFPPTTALWLGRLNNRLYLIDGQHRANAVAISGVPILCSLNVVDVASDEELEELYVQIDQGLQRTLSDAVNVSHISESSGLDKRQVELTSRAVRVIMEGFVSNTISSSMYNGIFRDWKLMLEEVEAWSAEAAAFFECIKDAEKPVYRGLTRQANMAVALVTLRYAEQQAREFWTAVAGDRLVRGTPQYRLAEEMRDPAGRSNQGINLEARKTAMAWNHFVADRPLHRLMIGDRLYQPINIAETPYDGREIRRHPALTNQLEKSDELDDLLRNEWFHKHPDRQPAAPPEAQPEPSPSTELFQDLKEAAVV